MNDDRLKDTGGKDYFDELLERVRDIRSSEKVFWRKVLDIYATSADYSANARESTLFFQTVQNKMLYAATGMTAAELIANRADALKPLMGMTVVKGSRPTLAEAKTAKNYLYEDELKTLNRLVSKYLKIRIGDIGYNTMRMWQGVSAYSDYEGIVSPAYTILKPVADIDAKYFSYLFKLPETVFLFYRFSQGLVDDTRNLKYENFKKITVRYPSDRREQTAIAKVLSTADREIDLLRQDIDQEKQKKKALMQLLLTGIVRVTPCH